MEYISQKSCSIWTVCPCLYPVFGCISNLVMGMGGYLVSTYIGRISGFQPNSKASGAFFIRYATVYHIQYPSRPDI